MLCEELDDWDYRCTAVAAHGANATLALLLFEREELDMSNDSFFSLFIFLGFAQNSIGLHLRPSWMEAL